MRKTQALFVLSLISIFMSACAAPEQEMSCTVEKTEEGVLVSCPDGTEALVSNGTDGEDGEDGTRIVTVVDIPPGEDCPAGGQAFMMDGQEISQSCNAHVVFEEIPEGEDCEFGGMRVVVNGDIAGTICESRTDQECDTFLVHRSLQIEDSNTLDAIRGCRVIEVVNQPNPENHGVVNVRIPYGDAFRNLESTNAEFVLYEGADGPGTSFREAFPALQEAYSFQLVDSSMTDVSGLGDVTLTGDFLLMILPQADACAVEAEVGELATENTNFPSQPYGVTGNFLMESDGATVRTCSL